MLSPKSSKIFRLARMAPLVEDSHVPETITNGSKAVVNGHAEKISLSDDTAANGSAQNQVSHDQNEGVQSNHSSPLQLRGILDQFKSFDVTPTIGKEFADVDLSKWLRASNSDELLRDLAITG